MVGSGSLARSVCYSVATEVAAPVRVSILARDGVKAAEIAFVAGARAAVSERPARFDWRRVDSANLADALGDLQPDLLVHCASYQSPWERAGAPSAWTDLVGAAGFGITLPLQAALALEAAESLHRVAPRCLLINACFPDAVNPVLHALGLAVFCGIGNIATMAATLGRKDQHALFLLAHHVHLHAPAEAGDEAMLWCDGERRDDVGDLLSGMRAVRRAELNQIAGHAAARLLDVLVTGAGIDTHVPAPLGLPGGYPVRVADRRIELRLPDGLDVDTAVAWHQRMALLDGVLVADGRIQFPSRVGEHVPDLADGFPITDIRSACTHLLALRERLRAVPADRGHRPGS